MKLKSIFMHQVTLVDSNGEKHFEASVTDLPVDLSNVDLEFLRERFVDALDRYALRVVRSDDVDSPTPRDVHSHLAESNLENLSKTLAERLAAVQKLNSKSGVLVVADATLDNAPCLLVAKVEHQEAMRVEPMTSPNGQRGIVIQHIRDLVFSDNSKVYKIAMLMSVDDEGSLIEGFLADVQNGRNFANFFMGDFLGLRLAAEPEVLTEKFLNVLAASIEESTLDANEKIDAHAALALDIKSNIPTLDANDFIRRHIPASHQNNIAQASTVRGLPMTPFSKDPSRVKSRLDNLRMKFGPDISIDAPPSSIGDGGKVQVTKTDAVGGEERYNVTINDVTLRSVANSHK